LQPAWLKAALAGGATLESLKVTDKAGSAGKVVSDKAPASVGRGASELDLQESEDA
jgi:hypothetical protein